MVKCVIHSADIHLRLFQRMEEYNEQLSTFINHCSDIASEYDKDEVRIVIAGDLFHNKNNISPEQITLASSFIRQLQNIAKTIVISGNHDLVVNNASRMDAMTSLFNASQFDNAFFFDGILNYESGIIVDDNITWAVYSVFDDFSRPDIENAISENPDNTVIGLYHGSVIGASLNNGTVMDSGLSKDAFKGCDIVMAGHIHKRQEIKCCDAILLYPGSLIQQDFGETVTQHGFAIWDIEKKTYNIVDMPSSYNLYKFSIKSIDDVDQDQELLINY